MKKTTIEQTTRTLIKYKIVELILITLLIAGIIQLAINDNKNQSKIDNIYTTLSNTQTEQNQRITDNRKLVEENGKKNRNSFRYIEEEMRKSLRRKLIRYKLIELIILILVIIGFIKFASQHHTEQEMFKKFSEQIMKQHEEHHQAISRINIDMQKFNTETNNQSHSDGISP